MRTVSPKETDPFANCLKSHQMPLFTKDYARNRPLKVDSTQAEREVALGWYVSVFVFGDRVMNFRISAASLAACFVFSATAPQAAVMIIGEEVGSDVVFTLSGTYDVSQLTLLGTAQINPAVDPSRAVLVGGSSGAVTYDFYSGLTSFPTNLGTGGTDFGVVALSSDFALTRSMDTRLVGVQTGTTTGTVSGSLTFQNDSYASLGLMAGMYDWTWAGDSATVDIRATVTTPSQIPVPASMPLLAGALFGAGWMVRRKTS